MDAVLYVKAEDFQRRVEGLACLEAVRLHNDLGGVVAVHLLPMNAETGTQVHVIDEAVDEGYVRRQDVAVVLSAPVPVLGGPPGMLHHNLKAPLLLQGLHLQLHLPQVHHLIVPLQVAQQGLGRVDHVEVGPEAPVLHCD